MIFAPVLEIRTLHLNITEQRRLFATSASIVHCLRFGKEDDFPAGRPKTTTPVEILSVHPETIIEWTHLLKRFAPHQPEATIEDFDLANGIVLKITHQVSREGPGSRSKPV
jgi:hypothetical protein